jgi:hypothetical protein
VLALSCRAIQIAQNTTGLRPQNTQDITILRTMKRLAHILSSLVTIRQIAKTTLDNHLILFYLILFNISNIFTFNFNLLSNMLYSHVYRSTTKTYYVCILDFIK